MRMPGMGRGAALGGAASGVLGALGLGVLRGGVVGATVAAGYFAVEQILERIKANEERRAQIQAQITDDLKAQNEALEEAVRERTAELRESEARYRSLAELASDWYWEQDESGAFTKVSGPVADMLGLQVDTLLPVAGPPDDGGWDLAERQVLWTNIEARRPFIDYVFHRRHGDGSRQQFRVSGQPMFDQACRYVGYRGIGVEVTSGA